MKIKDYRREITKTSNSCDGPLEIGLGSRMMGQVVALLVEQDDGPWFGERIRSEREAAGMTLEALGSAVGMSGARVQQIETAPEAPKDPAIVFRLEEALELPAGSLSRRLGYIPADNRTPLDVASAIQRDPRLDDDYRPMVLRVYREAVSLSSRNRSSSPAKARAKSSRKRTR